MGHSDNGFELPLPAGVTPEEFEARIEEAQRCINAIFADQRKEMRKTEKNSRSNNTEE